MVRRLPSQPPVLPGFSYVHVLGSGGFADVFLYEQNMPRRQVAVKVMLSEVVNDQVRQMFQAEANLMAQLSTHPSILTVYQASVSSDGRPYLVMELCSSSLSERYRREPIPVPEVLRIAIKIGSAVETAHRAGVLHRDIKPSNILQTAYGHPVLSDFGIASTLGGQKDENSVGLSIPWSAPEVLLDETPGSIASEVWSLAATTYSLLAGRSPFEVPGGANSSSDLMGRIARAKPQAIGRPDVPASLEALLRRGMSRRPEQRPESALEFVRELQLVETELGLPQTAAEIAMDDWALGTVADQEERTRLRPVSTGSAPPKAGRRRRRPVPSEPYAPVGTVRDRSAPDGPFSRSAPGAAGTGFRRMAWALAAAAALVTVLGTVALVVLVRAVGDGIPVVSDIQADVQSGGRVEFSWPDPGISDGDRYQITVTDDGVRSTPALQSASRFVVDTDAGHDVCVTVVVNRDGTTGAASAEKCVDVVED
ncbi:serine/threonine-protein kinase [Protaetiibacter mangrovi]|uniref:non-specific serine/threonine protein kinase n=1 Tax=Protaetiibacter mangrovi TaxID=2970926 RepID=A0ABT1ZJ39_9MICO|nr:serine/threonine-protein kinase [Protaetiibacter mangrovi]MCS0500719.1 serine/threonine protein kinase [Protaetiibacter mangrovi]TPW91258.1 serine/threonine protein kinase [Schumannella luteola]